jgi:hypothetical protein
MDCARPASSSVDEMMTTALLLDGALGDMVDVSTPRTVADGEEGVWQTVRRGESHPQEQGGAGGARDSGAVARVPAARRAAVRGASPVPRRVGGEVVVR